VLSRRPAVRGQPFRLAGLTVVTAQSAIEPTDAGAHGSGQGHGNRAIIAALVANTFIALCKFAGWALTGASSMLAEAIHSVADTGNQFLLLIGGRRARRTPTEEHPFGFGRERYVFAFMVAIVMFSIGGVFALYEAYHKLHETLEGHPDKLLESRWWWVPLVILGAAIIAEGLSFRTALKESDKARGRQRLSRFIRSAKAPELPVVLLEDFAALVGLVFALLGVALTKITHNGIFDVLGTALIGLLLVAVAITLAVETKSLLLGEAASPESITRIAEAVTATEGIDRIIHMKTLHLGPEEIMVAAKIGVRPGDSAVEVAELIDRAEVAIRQAEPMVTALYLEPDIYTADYRPAPRPERPTAPSH
jgi:cation diffusion facilitator family transporter